MSKQIKKRNREKVQSRNESLLWLIPLVLFLIVIIKPELTGFVVKGNIVSYKDSINLEFVSDSEYEWIVSNSGSIGKISLNGSIEEGTEARVYIENKGLTYLVFDTERLDLELTSITGLLSLNNTLEDEIIIPEVNDSIENTTIPQEEEIIEIIPIEETIPEVIEENEIIAFYDVCEEACLIDDFNSSSYNLLIEIDSGKLIIDEIRYDVREIMDVIPEIVNETIEVAPEGNKTESSNQTFFSGSLFEIQEVKVENGTNFTGIFNHTLYNSSGGFIYLNFTDFNEEGAGNTTYFTNGSYTTNIISYNSPVAFKNISWVGEVPYNTEIGRAVGDSNDATDEDGFINSTGLVLLYHFNNETQFGENDSFVYDYSMDVNSVDNETNNGTCRLDLNDCPAYKFTDKKLGRASMDFDGSDDFIDTTLDFSGTTDFTISLWTYIQTHANVRTLWSADGVAAGCSGEGLFLRNSGSINYRVASTNSIFTIGDLSNRWVHIVTTYSASEKKLYLDGDTVLDTSGGSATNGDVNFQIGNYNGCTPNVNFNGLIDEVAIWNRTLSSSEILKLYKRGVLQLNLSVRSCDDANCVGETFSEPLDNFTFSDLNTTITPNSNYFQYRATFATDNLSWTPKLYNVTIGTDELPVINVSFNISKNNVEFNDVLNISFNLTDDTSLLHGNITYNMSGVLTKINFTFSGERFEISNTTKIIVNRSEVINVTGYVTDSSNNVVQNSTLITVTDITKPSITLISPRNRSGDRDGNITFIFNVTDLTSIDNCSVIINNVINTTETSITRNISQNFTRNNMSIGQYNWSVNCTDNSANIGDSLTRRVISLRQKRPNGTSTDLTTVNISNITNFKIENTVAGRINFTQFIDLSGGGDIDRYVNITRNRIFINASALPALNKSAVLYFYNLTSVNPRITRDGAVCPASICTKTSYVDNTLEFNVTQFSVYSSEETPATAEESTTTSTATSSSSRGGAGYGTVDIILPENVNMHIKDELEIPIIIFNSGNVHVKDIVINTNVDSDSVNIQLTKYKFDIIRIDENVKTKLIISSDGLNNEKIKLSIIVGIVVEGVPLKTVSKELIINLVDKFEGNRTLVKDRLEFTKRLFENNPDCNELEEMLINAKEANEKDLVGKALTLIDSAESSCRELLELKEKKVVIESPKQIRRKLSLGEILLVVLSALTIIIYIFVSEHRKSKRKMKRSGMKKKRSRKKRK
tara:strand:+ start:1467 stop:5102 length:3636 start_codon:yes stop_codon:yes gene_type:complete